MILGVSSGAALGPKWPRVKLEVAKVWFSSSHSVIVRVSSGAALGLEVAKVWFSSSHSVISVILSGA